jgi:hypothetical protein
MSKSNKELAVELYCAIIQAAATVAANSNNSAVSIPTAEEAVERVSQISELLAKVKD